MSKEVHGPALADTAALLAWFEGAGAGKRVRLPIVLVPDPLGLSTAFVGPTPGPAPAGALHLKLDDTSMSVGLADRMAPDCPYDVPCAIVVEGTWGATLATSIGGPGLGGPALPGMAQAPTPHPFRVLDYKGVAAGDLTHVVVVE